MFPPLCAFYRIMRAGNGAGPGSSSRDRTFPVPSLRALPENGPQLSLSIRFFCPDLVLPILDSRQALSWTTAGACI